MKETQISYDYIDITKNTENMKAFFVIRDHADLYEETRNKEGGGIGIPLFVEGEKMTLDMNEALGWMGLPPVSDEDYEKIIEQVS